MEIWPFIPQVDFTEVLEWKTEVIKCKAAEQRISLRHTPRSYYDYSLLLTESQFSKAKLLLKRIGSSNFMLPLWGELKVLGGVPSGSTTVVVDTSLSSYVVGKKAIIYDTDDHYEVVEVISVSPLELGISEVVGGFTSCLIMPLVESKFSSAVGFRRIVSDLVPCSVKFSSTESTQIPPVDSLPTHQGSVVLTSPIVITSGLEESIQREVTLTDSLLGLVDQQSKYNDLTHDSRVSWSCLNPLELWEVKRFLYYCLGKQKRFWLPSWNRDIDLVEPILVDDEFITVQGLGWPETFQGTPVHLSVITPSGDFHFFTVVGSVTVGDTDLLYLSSPSGVSIPLLDVDRVCFLSPTRLDADRVEIRHLPAGLSTISIPVTGVQDDI